MRTAASVIPLDQAEEYLSRVVPWPEAGGQSEYVFINWTFQIGDMERHRFAGQSCRTLQQAVQCVRYQLQRGGTRDVYVCMSTQSEEGKRAGANALRFKSLFADIDVKEGAYASTNAAANAVRRFCKAIQLPLPTVWVKSGSGGLHVYWTISTDYSLRDDELSRLGEAQRLGEGRDGISVEVWRPLAHALSRALTHYGVHHDAGCTTDAARILRVPQTLNYKNEPPAPVVCGAFQDDASYDDLRRALEPFLSMVPRRHHSVGGGVGGELAAGIEVSSPPANLQRVLPECAFLREAWDTEGATYNEPLWDLTTLAATFTEGGRADAHKMAQGHPGYDYDATERKYDNKENAGVGWPLCDTIHSRGYQGCKTCPHFGKHKSPLHFQIAPPKPPLPPGVMPFPEGYRQDADGYIWRDKKDVDTGLTESKLVAVFPFIHSFLTPDPYDLHFQTLRSGQPEHHILRMADVTRELQKTLAMQGLEVQDNDVKDLRRFLLAWMTTLRAAQGFVMTSSQFGWVINKDGVLEGFTFGGKTYTPTGNRPAMNKSLILADLYRPTGELDEWKIAADFCLSQQRQDLAAILSTAFAAPLFRFTRQPGVLVAAFSAASGIGKTTTMRIAQSVWGHPKDAMQGLDDTAKSIPKKLGELQSLPVYWDELQYADQMNKFVKLVFSVAEGRDMMRLNRNADIRKTLTWESMLVSASNDSVRSAVAKREQNGTVAGVNRIFEFEVQKVPKKITSAEADAIAGTVFENYGKAGEVYAKWLGENFADVKKDVLDYRTELEKWLGSEEQDRLWCSAIATMVMGAQYANDVGLTKFDVDALRDFLVDALHRLRGDRNMDDPNDPKNLTSVLQDYLTYATRHTLRTDNVWKGRGKQNIMVKSQPHQTDGITVQIGEDDNILRMSEDAFVEWLKRTHRNVGSTKSGMIRLLGAKESKNTLGAGTTRKWQFQAKVLEFDLLHPALGALHSP